MSFLQVFKRIMKSSGLPTVWLVRSGQVLSSPKAREKSRKTTKLVLRCDLRPSRKAELGRYLSSMDWRVLFTGLQSCEELLGVWSQGTDGNGSTIRTLLFDYKKAFDLIDHSILVRK